MPLRVIAANVYASQTRRRKLTSRVRRVAAEILPRSFASKRGVSTTGERVSPYEIRYYRILLELCCLDAPVGQRVGQTRIKVEHCALRAKNNRWIRVGWKVSGEIKKLPAS
jgi:hypothetical protein